MTNLDPNGHVLGELTGPGGNLPIHEPDLYHSLSFGQFTSFVHLNSEQDVLLLMLV